MNIDKLDDGEIESSIDSAQDRVHQQQPWLSLLPKDFLTVLDVGAGAGFHSKWLLDHGRQPVALDRYGKAFRFGDQIELIQSELNDFDGTRLFDALFCSHVLEHFPDPASGLASMRRLIRDGGYLFVIVPPYVGLSCNYHWHIGWNCTQLALLMAASGFDCSGAVFMRLGMNICGWGRKVDLPETKFNLQRSLERIPKAMAETFFMENGLEFLPGDIAYADPTVVHRLPVEQRFEMPGFEWDKGKEILFPDKGWRSVEAVFDERINLTHGILRIVLLIEGTEPSIRIALGSGKEESPWTDVAERYFDAKLGNIASFAFTKDDFRTQAGSPDLSRICQISIGGFGSPDGAQSRVRVWCTLPNGNLVQF